METLADLSLLVFVIGSMGSMGLSLKIKKILEPLKNVRLVVLALVETRKHEAFIFSRRS